MIAAVQPMSGDEVFATIASAVLALIAWIVLYVQSLRFGRPGLPRGPANALLFALPACLVLVLFILRTLASHDVRDDGRYIAMYGLMGAAWAALAPGLFLPGISLRDDFFERRNSSAALAAIGFMLGSTFCFSGGNVGDGPGWWVVVFCAVIANGALGLLWVFANVFAPLADRIVVDRDPAAGLRIGGFFAGAGLVLGRAVAGDWASLEATLRDFALRAWPVWFLLAFLVVTERLLKPRYRPEEQELLARGWMPALVHVGIGLAAVLAQGRIE